MNTIEELPPIQTHIENRKEYYQLTKLRIINDYLQFKKISKTTHFFRKPWLSEEWESLIHFGKQPRKVKVFKENFKIIREFYFY